MICNHFLSGLCPLPPTSPLDLTGWFAKPKPNPLPAAKKPSGQRLKVLHLSDLHIDPRRSRSYSSSRKSDVIVIQVTPTERRRTALVACAAARTTLPLQLLARYPSQLRVSGLISGRQPTTCVDCTELTLSTATRHFLWSQLLCSQSRC